MKYSSSNKPLVCMQTQSTCYKGTTTMTPRGVLWHGTGANNPTLKRYVQPSDVKPAADTYTKEKWLQVLGKNAYNNDWNHIERQAGLNAWIGKLADELFVTSITDADIEKYFSTQVEPKPTPVTPVEPDTDDNKIDADKVDTIMALLEKLLNFFIKLFGINRE